jgi:AcrR family transcriptional regulator
MSTAAPATDGRVLRGQRTRRGIVQALLDLLTEGELTPTATQIAGRAGVSVRSVFQHFEDMEALYADLAASQRERVAPLLDALEHPAGTEARIAALVAHRAELFDTIAPVRHAIGNRALRSAALRARIEELSAALRAQVAAQFVEELAALPRSRRDALLDVCDLLCSFEAWDRLRVVQRLDRPAAERAVTDGLRAVLT